MSTATVTSKGQITIPVEVRNKLGLRPGSRLAFVPTASGSYEIHAQSSSIRDLEGVVGPPPELRTALAASRDGIDFADAVIAELGRAAGCHHTVRFDRRAARSAHMRLLGTA